MPTPRTPAPSDEPPSDGTSPRARSPRWWVRPLVGTALVGAAVAWFLHAGRLDLRAVGRRLSDAPLWMVGLVLVGACTQVLLQGARFWRLFPPASRPRMVALMGIFGAGQLVNAIAPARSGDVLKVILLRRSPVANQDGLAGLVGVMAADKLVDLAGLLLVIASSGPALRMLLARAPVPPLWLAIAVALAIAVLLVFERSSLRRSASRLRSSVRGFRSGVSAFKHPPQLLLSLVFAAGSWAVEGVLICGVCAAMGYSIAWGTAVVALVTLNLGIAIPVTLANIGVFEAALAFGLTLNGVPTEVAVPAATLHHLLQIAAVATWALLTGFRWPRRRSEPPASSRGAEARGAPRARDR